MTDTSGVNANKSGKWLEQTLSDMLKRKEFNELSNQEKAMFVRSDGDLSRYDGRWFVQQARLGRNIYGAVLRTDFFLVEPELYPEGLIIEAKWQGSAGSIDEKYVFTALSLIAARCPSLMVIDGGGARPCAISWLKTKARKEKGFSVMTLPEAIAWINNTF